MDMITVCVGLDYHSDSIRVCVMAMDGDVLVNRNVENQIGEVQDAIRDCAPTSYVEVRMVALEACCGSADFATKFAECTEWPVKLAHAGTVRRLKSGPDKTDHGDAWHLANLARVEYLPEVWLADNATRQLRRLVRHRQSLVADAKDIKLRIRALLKEERIVEKASAGSWTKIWREWLLTVPLGEHSRWIMEQELKRLDELDKAIQAADERMTQATKSDAIVERLREQPGVGLVTAVMLRAAIGRFDRFRTGKQLSRYCGLSPCNASSGKRQADAGLIKAGPEDLRSVLIQLAKRLPRHVPEWHAQWVRLRRTKPANVVSAAIANRWMRKLFHTMKDVPMVQAA